MLGVIMVGFLLSGEIFNGEGRGDFFVVCCWLCGLMCGLYFFFGGGGWVFSGDGWFLFFLYGILREVGFGGFCWLLFIVDWRFDIKLLKLDVLEGFFCLDFDVMDLGGLVWEFVWLGWCLKLFWVDMFCIDMLWIDMFDFVDFEGVW